MKSVILVLGLLCLFSPRTWAQETDRSDRSAETNTEARFADDTGSSGDEEAQLRAFMVDEQRKKLSRFRYMMLGYGLIWVCLGFYLFSLNRRIHQVGKEIGELHGRLEDARRSNPS